MTDDPRGDPVPVVADALARHALRHNVRWGANHFVVCRCGDQSVDAHASVAWLAFRDHQSRAVVERLYGEGLLAYGVGKREET